MSQHEPTHDPTAPRGGRTVDLTYGIDLVQADPEWPTKLGLFLLVWAVPFVGWLVVMGWLAYGTRRAIARVTPVLLPPTADIATLLDYAETGFKAMLVSFVWSLPPLALLFGTMGCLYFAVFAAALAAVSGADGTDGASLVLVPLIVCGGLVIIVMLAVLNAALSMPASAATLRAELSGQIGRGFDTAAVFEMVKRVLRDWLLNLVLLAIVTLLSVSFANALPLIGMFVSTFLVAILRTFAVVSVYEKYLAAGGTPVAIGPLEPRVSAR